MAVYTPQHNMREHAACTSTHSAFGLLANNPMAQMGCWPGAIALVNITSVSSAVVCPSNHSGTREQASEQGLNLKTGAT